MTITASQYQNKYILFKSSQRIDLLAYYSKVLDIKKNISLLWKLLVLKRLAKTSYVPEKLPNRINSCKATLGCGRGSEEIPNRSCSVSTSAGSGMVPGPLNTDLQAKNRRWIAVTLHRVLRRHLLPLTSLSPFLFDPDLFSSSPLLASTFIQAPRARRETAQGTNLTDSGQKAKLGANKVETRIGIHRGQWKKMGTLARSGGSSGYKGGPGEAKPGAIGWLRTGENRSPL